MLAKGRYFSALLISLFSVVFCQDNPRNSNLLRAKVDLLPAATSDPNKEPVYGTLHLSQDGPDAPVHVYGVVSGLTKGLHGFHVHTADVRDRDCKGTGGHFNPAGVPHSSPRTEIRHVGDLGNIRVVWSNRPHSIDMVDSVISLQRGRRNSVVGRAFVIHAGEDDLGLGGNEGSLASGNAGGRVSCGNIELINDY